MAGIADFVRNDLRHIRDVYQQTIAADPGERDTGGFVRDLTGYLVAEELVIAPVLEGKFADNAERQERIRKDYKSIKEKLRRLLDYHDDEESCAASMRSIWVDLEPHLIQEEKTELAWLDEHLSPQASTVLKRKYSMAKDLLSSRYKTTMPPDEETISILESSPEELVARHLELED